MNQLPQSKKPLNHFLNLNYPIQIVEEEGTWVASIPDLPGCSSFGDTPDEAVRNVQETKQIWIQSQYKMDGDIPEPTDEEGYSGRFVLRVPKTLHRYLTYQAKQQGMSLNSYALYLLASRQPLDALLQMVRSSEWCSWSNSHYNFVCAAGSIPAANVEFVSFMRKPVDRLSWSPKMIEKPKKQFVTG